MRTNLLVTIREIPRRRGSLGILFSVLLGLVLARSVIASPSAGIIVLSSGILLALTIFLRKIDYIVIAWVILTTFIWVIMTFLLPEYYFSIGRAIFWGLLGCVILAWALDNIFRGRQFIAFDNVPLKATIVIFVLWATLSLVTSVNLSFSVRQVIKFVIVFVVSYMFFDFFSRDRNNIKKLLNVVSLLAVSLSLMTIAIVLESFISGVPIYKRISLWFWNPNVLGTFLFICIPISIAAGFDFIQSRRLKIFLIGIMLLALFFSFHRTSWIATSVSVFFLLSKNRMKTPLRLAIVAGLFLSAVLFPVVGDDVYDYVTGERYTGRIEIWKAAWNTACDYPVLGTGPGTSVGRISRYIDTPVLRNEDTHSTYLKNAVEMGFASVVIMLTFYVIFFYSSWKIERNLKSDYLKWVIRGTTATFLGLLIHGIFECGFFLTPFGAGEFTVIFPYILVALPFAAKKLEESEGSDAQLGL